MSGKYMIELLLITFFLGLIASHDLWAKNSVENTFKPLSFEEASAKADSILSLMTLDEKLAYIGGDKSFFIRAIPRLNLPEIYMADATQGIHIRQEFRETDLSTYQPTKSTAFPAPILLASTWNKELAYNYAKSIGEECRASNVGVLLGPGMNLYRISQCGRNFEYFGEDPYLAAGMIENYVKGLQSTGTIATLKHFVANNTDFFRRKSNSIVDERTLHEVYSFAFKAGIDADAKAVMTAYNLVNGEWCGESNYVINDLLRKQLGFNWLVMTDWWSVYDGVKVAKSGQDLEMPYTIALDDAEDLLQEGDINVEDIDRMVRSILTSCFAMKLYDRKADSSYYETFPDHVQTALQTAREGIVLLENKDAILPIKSGIKNILLTGSFVEEIVSGGGAATVHGYDNITMLQAIQDEFKSRVKFIKKPNTDQIKSADLILCNIGTSDSEGWDRPFALPDDQEKLVKMCVENNQNTVVIVTSGSGIKMTNWNEKAAAILYCWYPGQTGNKAIAEILSGKTNPSGKLPITIEKNFKDSPGFGYTQGEELYEGWNGEGEKAHPVYDVKYDEGVFIGYRWYEAKNIEPLYPFGYGLSYTSFEYENVTLSKDTFKEGDSIEVSVKVKNKGNFAGSEIVQIYIEDVESSVDRPIKELKGYTKIYLEPGEAKIDKIILNLKDFSFWNPSTKNWFAEKGIFKIHIGSSLINIIAIKEVELL
ncbi:MAG: glycoside hydrolase family 3 C-terminal domain-containing protein [Calditrichaceae bacterium]